MMGLIVSEVYDALVDAGASPEKATAAAGAIPSPDNMATREDIARIEANMATKEELAALRADMAMIGANMVTKEEFSRLDKQVAVLRFAVFGFGSTIVGLLVKLAFFP